VADGPLEAGIPSRPVTIFQDQPGATAIIMAGLGHMRAERDTIVRLRVFQIKWLLGTEIFPAPRPVKEQP